MAVVVVVVVVAKSKPTQANARSETTTCFAPHYRPCDPRSRPTDREVE